MFSFIQELGLILYHFKSTRLVENGSTSLLMTFSWPLWIGPIDKWIQNRPLTFDCFLVLILLLYCSQHVHLLPSINCHQLHELIMLITWLSIIYEQIPQSVNFTTDILHNTLASESGCSQETCIQFLMYMIQHASVNITKLGYWELNTVSFLGAG